MGSSYRVSHLLGRGGMGEVWAAVGPHGPVAIKVLLERVARRKEVRLRFEREAITVSRVSSRYVCKLLDRGFTNDGSMFLVFELLDGESLAERLTREAFLAFDELAPLMTDVLQGIADAHSAGVLHRDLKPGNIFIVPDGPREIAKILDFGMSKIIKDTHAGDEPSLTAFNGTVGTFAHMAPEQVRGAARVDERADIYGMASVAFRALAGRLPFEGTSSHIVATQKVQNPAPTLEEATGLRWPRLLEEFFAIGLARSPVGRFTSAEEASAHWNNAFRVSLDVRKATCAIARPPR